MEPYLCVADLHFRDPTEPLDGSAVVETALLVVEANWSEVVDRLFGRRHHRLPFFRCVAILCR
jgi:hypothetical protein